MPLIKLFLLPLLLFTGWGSSKENNCSDTSNDNLIPNSKQEVFSYLRCHRQAKNIVVNWGVTSSAGIDHFVIYHSETGDDVDYIPVETVPANADKRYSFKHESVFPGYHYYYIKAVMGSNSVNSAVDIVRIVSH
jgi:hypothetical protein